MNDRTGNKTFRRLLRLAQATLCLWLLIAGASKAFSQADEGAITGSVVDTTGAAIPNAQVTLTNVDTGLVLHSQTDGSGVYIFSPIKIGNYKVESAAAGFSPTIQENIQVHVQDRVEVNLQLKAGSEATVVTVTSAPALLQTEEGSTGQVMETQTINDTPLNGRNWVFIAQLAAGVAPSNGARGQNGGDFNANGQRAEQNNYIMDGVDNNVNVVDFFNGASYVVRPPPDALAEFKVQTGSYSSEFGHSAGAVINASIKSGTNQLHGSLWEYLRNDAFDVREFFQGASPVAKYRQNQFGATLGFPIFKEKLFFFGDTEADRIVFAETHSGLTVPTLKMRTGDFSDLLSTNHQLNNNVVQLYVPNPAANGTTPVAGNRLDLQPGVTLDPVAEKLLSLFPAPNVGLPGQTYSNFTDQTNTLNNTFQWDVRTDWNITSSDQAFARYSYNHEPISHPAPFGPILDGGGFADTGQVTSLGENFAGSETHLFNPTTTNEFRFGYNYGHFAGLHENANNATLASGLGLGGIPTSANNSGLPYFNVSGISSFGSPQFYATNEYENVYQILDNVTKVHGNHNFKAGVNIQRIRFSTSQPTQPRGTYNFNGTYTSQQGTSNTGFGVADFLTDNMNSAAISNTFTSDDVRFNRSGYAQDDWKVNQRLTVNYGARYDYSTPYLERHDDQAALVPTSAPTAGHSTAEYRIPKSKSGVALPFSFTRLLAADNITVVYTGNRYLVEPQKSNVAPRVGFAFKATDKAVIHGGYGVFFGGLESTGYYPNLGENFPFEFDSNFNSGSCAAGGACPTNGITLETGFANAISAGLLQHASQPNLRGSEPKVRTPYSEQFNLTVEYGLSNSMVAAVGYVGAVSRHLQSFPDPNGQVVATTNGFGGYKDANGDQVNPYRPYPHFGGITYTAYDGSGNYNSLQSKLEKRLTNGVYFLATYTWSHSLDDAPTPLGSANDNGYRSLNILGLAADYGNSGYDVRHRVTFNANAELPFGHGRKYLNNNAMMDFLVGGFSSSLTFRAQTGEPISIGTSSFTGAGGLGANAIKIGDPFKGGGGAGCPATVKTVQHWYNPCAFQNPEAGSSANLPYPGGTFSDGTKIPGTVSGNAALAFAGNPRSQTYGPGYDRVDMSLFKDFHVFHESALQFRADVFNLLNTPAYGNPNDRGIDANGGQITGSRGFSADTPDSRFFQFALKYHF
ncbi:MAG TPA: TonB-dependent receptor [Acidisarcina sp.]